MGDVWMATDTRADRPVALKFIKAHLLDDPAHRLRFLNEAKMMGRLEHDRIVTLYQVLESGGHLALVLRFIDGASLADRIDQQGALSLDAVMAAARDLLPALGFAHERGIIHRDIKPQNVLVDRGGRCFLTDFGIAVMEYIDRGTVTGFAIGTPHYMSPEQIRTPQAVTIQNDGHRSDIYSFGVVLFEMLTGRLPFGEVTSQDSYRIQHAHCEEPPPRLRDINPNVPATIEAVVLRALSKDPGDRPQNCVQFLAELETAAVGVPPLAVSAGRPATVVEGRTPIGGGGAVAPLKVPSQSPQQVAPRPPSAPPQKGVPKIAWLALGAVLIFAGVGYEIWSSGAVKPEPPPVVEKPPEKPPETPPLPLETKKTKDQQKKSQDVVVTPPVQPKPDEGQTLHDDAESLAGVRKFCDAEAQMAQALKRPGEHPPGWSRRREEFASACQDQKQAEALHNQAEKLFVDGRYCDAAASMTEAVKKDLELHKDWPQRRARMLSDCEDSRR